MTIKDNLEKYFSENQPDIKSLECVMVQVLVFMKVIDARFTGNVTIHMNDGSILDYDKSEKNLRKKLKSDK